MELGKGGEEGENPRQKGHWDLGPKRNSPVYVTVAWRGYEEIKDLS